MKSGDFVFFLLIIIYLLTGSFAFPLASQQSSQPVEGKIAGQPVLASGNGEMGLLFLLSGSKGLIADYASGGQVNPNFLKDLSVIPDGAKGPGIRAEDSQLLTYWAPGNIFAQRGTLSFFWRSRYPVGQSPFPIFRVSYADHSSWDMVWLRIDYNGSGFDAFVTDIGLSRTRISFFPDKFPDPTEWTHIALSWDETEGIRFYVNGKLAAVQSVNNTVFDTGLDQFGPHSRIISPYQVQSAYSFMRGGDIDEIRIYDRMLPDEIVSDLAEGKTPEKLREFRRDLNESRWRNEWWIRNGWNLPNSPPPVLPSNETSVRKVEIHDAYDIKRWYWKANDGIRETTWPGVYNMSRLPGRYDYFVLPDWDCYSGSGQTVKFTMPDEKWNHIEIWGKAWGQLTIESDTGRDFTFGVRTQNQVKSVHTLKSTGRGGKIRFDNALIEEPIGSFDAYYVSEGKAPAGTKEESFILSQAPPVFLIPALENASSFIRGRYPSDERTMMLAVKGEAAGSKIKTDPGEKNYPFINILIPYSSIPDQGLDGIEIRMPLLKLKPTHKELFPLNIRVKDPLWLMRDLADFSFSVRPGDSPVLWIDTRDRILPAGHALYITIAGAGADLTPELLQGTRIKLVYKSREAAGIEHEADRFTQVRDLYSHIVEERPRTSKLNLYNRFMADCNDLLSVNPDHWLAQTYRYAVTGRDKPSYTIARCPDGVPEWAFLQTEYLRFLERMISYYIDKRQIANGEFGGGLSDDGDLTNMWPGMAFLGMDPGKLLKSLKLHMSAYYDQERDPYNAPLRQRSLPLFTNGLATIFTDELHALEDGIQVVAQLQLLDYGNPLHTERAMEISKRLVDDVTGINSAGHRHFLSRYYGATRIALEDPWQWSVNRSYHVLQPAYLLARFNGNPEISRMIVELADGLLAHLKNNEIRTDINFATDADREDTGMAVGEKPWSLLYAAYKITGEGKYLVNGPDASKKDRLFDKDLIAERYRNEITNLAIREYINTEGSIWIDRLSPFNPIIQEDRLGGVALTRTNVLYPKHFVSWKFEDPSDFDDVAIFLPDPSENEIRVIASNLNEKIVRVSMTAWELKPGKWKITGGLDTNEDQVIDSCESVSIFEIERGSDLSFDFMPKKYNIISLRLIEPSAKDYSRLPDLAIGREDINIKDGEVTVKVHNIGSIDSPATTLEIKDSAGKIVASAHVPPVEAPADLIPRWKKIVIPVVAGTDLTGSIIQLDPGKRISEITLVNNRLKL